MNDYERYIAIREGHFNVASDEYFDARPELDNPVNRRIFYGAHCKGYDAAMESGEAKLNVPPDVLKYAKAMKSDGYRGPLHWAMKIINWVVEQGGEPAANKDCPRHDSKEQTS